MKSPWSLIPENLVPALQELHPSLQLLSARQLNERLEPHPYPSTALAAKEIRDRTVPAQLAGLTAPSCWVDAGTGRAFRGAFPMTAFEISHPMEEPLGAHQEWLEAKLKDLNDNALGVKRSRSWEILIVVPVLDEQEHLNRLRLYGAYKSVDSVEHIHLQSWALIESTK